MQIRAQTDFSGHTSAESIFQSLLQARGLITRQAIDEFLHPPQPDLGILIKGTGIKNSRLVQAKKLIGEALSRSQNILIFGDYDADGITSTAILWLTLSKLARGTGAKIMPFIPDRIKHGYGLSLPAVADILSGHVFEQTAFPDFKPDIVITVDNGIVAHEAVKKLKNHGLQVIITDHHTALDSLPAADLIIHSTATSGAGIAWLLALALTDSSAFVLSLIELAAIGVVADQMPLTGLNRSLVARGLKVLEHSHNPGISALKHLAGIADKKLTTYDINFVLAPRLNAAGRIGNPLEALRLLCSHDERIVKQIAVSMDAYNRERQRMTDLAVDQALKTQVGHKLIFLDSPDFHEGIIGLVAGKLVEKYQRPAIVVSRGKATSKGSARSLGKVNITDLLRRAGRMLNSVGGHQLAGGFSLKTADLAKFKKKIISLADSTIGDQELDQSIQVDGTLRLTQTNLMLCRLLQSLEPFGMGNSKPRFVANNLRILEDRPVGRDGTHRKLVLEQDGVARDCIWFNGNTGPLKDNFSAVFTLEINTWRDREKVQLNIQHVI